MEKKIRIGLIGCGRVAENHIVSIKLCELAEITAIAGGHHAKELGERLNVPVLESDELCSSSLIDAVCILTPPQFHFYYAIKAIENGKHVLVEKPVSFSVEEIEQMKQAAEKKGVVCMPGHSYLYLPELARIKKVMEKSQIGIPGYVYMSETYYMAPYFTVKYTGPETDVLCHQLYLSLAFLGKPSKIAAFRTSFDEKEIETGGPQVSVMMEYEAGTIVHILVAWGMEDHSSDPWTFKVKILGSKGSMHFSRRDFVKNVGEGYDQCLYQEMFNCEWKWFVEECIIKGNNPLSTMEDAAWVCRLHNLIMKSIREEKVLKVEKKL